MITDIGAWTSTAKPGDVLTLAPGAYPWTNIRGKRWADPGIVIQGQPGVMIAGLQTDGSAGITFRDFEVVSSGLAVNIGGLNPERIVLDGLLIHADPSLDVTKLTAPGIGINRGSTCSVLNCDIHHVSSGIQHEQCDGLVIQGNRIFDINLDAIRGNSSNLTIEGNDISGQGSLQGVHMDGIQIWNKGCSTAPHNITVRRNRLTQGSGNPFQGIFTTNDTGLGYDSVLIEENLIASGHKWGITANGMRGLIIRNNYIASPGSVIEVDNSPSPAITGNIALTNPVLGNTAGGAVNTLGVSLADAAAWFSALTNPDDPAALKRRIAELEAKIAAAVSALS